MLYVRNVPRRERAVRVVTGLAMMVGGPIGLQNPVFGFALAGVGAIALLTGFIGFCPLCAMVGRRMDAGK